MKNVELYWNGTHTSYAVLVSYGYGAGWSSWGKRELAYDKRIVEFWLAHKDNEEWMLTVEDYGWTGEQSESDAHKEAREFFQSIGYDDCPYMGGFKNIELQWIPAGEKWKIVEYDGAESIQLAGQENWNCFY